MQKSKQEEQENNVSENNRSFS